MTYTEKIRNAFSAFDDALRYREHYANNQIAAQESSCRISQALDADVLKVIVSALQDELKRQEALEAVLEFARQPYEPTEEECVEVKKMLGL